MSRRTERSARTEVLRASLALASLAGLLGCTATQMIALDVGPDPVVIFVDGERIDDLPVAIELRTNRDHTLFFQREGYLSQMIVVRTSEVDGRAQLAPDQVTLRLKRDASTQPEVSVELDE